MSRSASRRPVRLTVDHVAALPEPVRSCLTWELDPVRRARVRPDDAAGEKQAWVSGVLRDWGSCGRVVTGPDGTPTAYVVYAPAAYVPGADCFPTAPVSPDAVLLTTLWVHPDHVGGGLARVLVQAMARDLLERGGLRAVEAIGDATAPAASRTRQAGAGVGGCTHRCVVPADVWSRVGFRTVRPHPRHPRMRMDLATTLTWRDELEAALGRLVGVVRPETQPSPAPRAERGTTGDGG